jgi:hypothetical protein
MHTVFKGIRCEFDAEMKKEVDKETAFRILLWLLKCKEACLKEYVYTCRLTQLQAFRHDI